MLGYLQKDWQPHARFATGNLVEQRAGRFHFVGRKSACIHVGKAKGYPLEVEAVIRGAPDQGADAAAARRHIFPACRQKLARDKAPAIVEFKECLVMTGAGKVFRF